MVSYITQSDIRDNSRPKSISHFGKELLFVKFAVIIIIELLSLSVAVLCFQKSDAPAGFDSLFLLPASYCLFPIALPSKKIKRQFSLVNYIVLGLLFVRNVITPYFMINDTFNSTLGLATSDNAIRSILLIGYETLSIFFFIFWLEHTKIKHKIAKPISNHSNFYFGFIFISLLIISVSSFVLIPQIRNNYYSIFDSNFNSWGELDYSYRGNVFLRILGTLGGMSTEILRLIGPCFLMNFLAQKKKNIFTFLISICFIAVQIFFMTDQNAYVLMVMISQWIYLTSLYPKYKKSANFVVCILAIFLFYLMYEYRFSNTFFSKSFSMFLQAYVPGITHTAGVFNIQNNSYFFIWFNDLYCGLPFKSFLGLNSIASYADLWKAANNGEAQIASMISQSVYYFSPFGAPLLSCFFIWCSKKIEFSINDRNPILKATYIYLLIFMAAAPFVYNNCIFLNNFLQRIIFMILIGKTYGSRPIGG